jgi:uncharacterized Zn-binding protein involved in type VI secretion
MPEPAAKKDDKITATDTHVVQGVATTMPFSGTLDGNLSPDVLIEHKHAATEQSTATNTPSHAPAPDKPPSNQGTIIQGSSTVLINWRGAARNGDPAKTCNDPVDLPVGTVVATSTILVGG